MSAPQESAAPLAHLVVADRVTEKGQHVTVVAEDAARAALARELGCPAIADLSGRFHLRRKGREVLVTGTVVARLTRTCVVTLEPFEVVVEEPVEVSFAEPRNVGPKPDAGRRRRPAPDEPAFEPGEDEDDAPDPIVNGMIDLGALATEFVAIALDPYPRKPGAAFVPPAEAVEDVSPFAGLAALKKGGD